MTRIIKLLVILVLVSACASGGKKERLALREFVQQKKYAEAHKVIDSSKFYKDEDSQLLTLVEKGMLHHLEGNYYQAIQFLEKAKALSQDLYTKSFSGKAKSVVFNDNYDKYYGEVYERSMIHFYLSLSHFLLSQKGEVESMTDGKDVKPAKALTQNEINNEISKARSEILAWDSFLEGIRSERRGRSVFKYDLMAKVFGGFVHEATGSLADRQIALQLYKDAKMIMFRNYNSYKTFNSKAIKFKKDYSKLPNMKPSKVEKEYVDKTLYNKHLKDLLDYKILSLTKIVRRNDYNRMKKIHKPSKKVLKRLQKEKWANISVVFHEGMIAPKVADKQYYGLKKAMTSKNKGTRAMGAIGHLALTVFAANQLGLVPPPAAYHPAGVHLGVQTASIAAQEIAIEFELPKVENKTNDSFFILKIYDDKGQEVKKANLALVNPLGDIGEEAVAETSAWRYSRLGTRLALKHITAIMASYGTYKATEKKMGKMFAKSAALIQYLGVSKGIAASEKADTRFWSTLPNNLRMSQFYLPKGKYTLKVSGLVKKGDQMVPTKTFDLGAIEVTNTKQRKLVNYRSM